VVICLERGADLHVAQLMPLTLTVSCFSSIQIGFTFLTLVHLGSPGRKWVIVVITQTVCKSTLNTDTLIKYSCTTQEKISTDKDSMQSGSISLHCQHSQMKVTTIDVACRVVCLCTSHKRTLQKWQN